MAISAFYSFPPVFCRLGCPLIFWSTTSGVSPSPFPKLELLCCFSALYTIAIFSFPFLSIILPSWALEDKMSLILSLMGVFFQILVSRGQNVLDIVLDAHFLIRYLIHLLSPSFSSKPFSKRPAILRWAVLLVRPK